MVLKQPFWGQNELFNEVSLWHVQIDIIFPDTSGILHITRYKIHLQVPHNRSEKFDKVSGMSGFARFAVGSQKMDRSIFKDQYQLRENISSFGYTSLQGPEPIKRSDTGTTNTFLWRKIS